MIKQVFSSLITWIVSFLSKSLGIPLAKIATKSIFGVSLKEQRVFDIKKPKFYSMKMPVFSDVLSQDKIQAQKCFLPEKRCLLVEILMT